jgi:hypothetical protein
MKVGQKRSKTQRALDLEKVAKLRLMHRTNMEIAAELGVCERTIQRDLRKIEAQWQEAAAQDIGAIKARELAKLDALEAEAAAAWQRSKQENQKRIVEERPGIGGKASRVARIETSQGTGDPRYLTTILSIMERRARLIGADAPAKHALTDPTGTEDRTSMMAFPVPPDLTLEQWQAHCQKALQPKH